jgi:hypothetical protein
MGYEYRITFQVPAPEDHERFLDRLRAEPSNGEGEEFTVSLEPDGFYFCDHTRSARSSCALRNLIDQALAYSEVVIVEP